MMGLLFIKTSLNPGHPANDIRKLVGENRWDIEGVLYRAPETFREKSRIYVEVDKASSDREVRYVTGQIVLTIGDRETNLSYGDRIKFNTKLTLPRNYGNSGGFNYERFMLSRGVAVRGFVKNSRWIARLSFAGGNPFWKELERTRDHLRQFLDEQVQNPQRGMLKALLLGEKGEISKDIREAFIKTGTAHILAISGLHIGIIAFAAFWLMLHILSLSERLLLAFNIKKPAALFTIIPVIFYSFIGGFSIPTQRAMIMVLIFLLAILLDRERDLYNTLALAALVILLVHPLSILDVSFQLSFAAVISIIYIVPRIKTLRERDVEKVLLPGKKMKTWFVTFLLISLAASLGTSPIAAFYFHRISFVGLLSNLFVVPLIGFAVVPLTLIAGFISFFSFSLAAPFIYLSTFILNIAFEGVKVLSEIPYAYMWMTTPGFFEISLYYMGIISFLEIKKWRPARYILVVVIVLLILHQGSNYVFDKTDNRLRVTFISVGQGDATLIEFPKGKRMLIDGGGVRSQDFDIGERVIAPFLWKKGIKRVDYLVLTHPQADHLKGLIFIARNFEVREFWWNGDESKLPEFQSLMDVIKEKGIKRIVMNNESTPLNINGVDVEVLHPSGYGKALDTNNNSLVLMVKHDNVSLLLPGDIEGEGERAMIESKQALKSTVIKAPHHGSATSSTEAFLDRVDPEITVFSVGYNNRFGFPRKEIVNRYLKRGVDVFRTDEDGAITIITDGKELQVQTFR